MVIKINLCELSLDYYTGLLVIYEPEVQSFLQKVETSLAKIACCNTIICVECPFRSKQRRPHLKTTEYKKIKTIKGVEILANEQAKILFKNSITKTIPLLSDRKILHGGRLLSLCENTLCF